MAYSSFSHSSLPLLCCFFLAVTSTVAAKEFQVGDAVGWKIPSTNETQLYNVWASRRRFHIGDSLRFHYKNDWLVVVEKWGFYHCDSSNPISFFNDGDTVINLDKVGTNYFISGNTDRCKQGQRMLVVVMMSPAPISLFPPSIVGSPQNPYSAIASSPSHISSSGGPSKSGMGSSSSDSVTSFSVSISVIALIIGLGLCSLKP